MNEIDNKVGRARLTWEDFYQQHIPLNKEVTERAITVVEFIKEEFIPKLRESDSLFNHMYGDEIYYGGSFYDRLRITEATEFDLDVILELPIPKKEMKLKYGDGSSIPFGFAQIYCKSPPENLLDSNEMTNGQRKKFLNFFENERFIFLPLKIRNWFREVVTRAIKYYVNNPFALNENELTITKYKWGPYSPAATLKITTDNDLEVDIDLVPVLKFGKKMLVPKSYEGEQFQKVWRLSYPLIEKRLLWKQSCAKKVIRMLKWIRDNFKDWTWVSSYYLKTLVMLEVKRDGGRWPENEMSEKLQEMLHLLLDYLKNGTLPSLHDSRFNLLHSSKPTTLKNAERRLINFMGTSEDILQKLNNLSKPNKLIQQEAALVFEKRGIPSVEAAAMCNESQLEEHFEKAFPFPETTLENESDGNNEKENYISSCTIL